MGRAVTPLCVLVVGPSLALRSIVQHWYLLFAFPHLAANHATESTALASPHPLAQKGSKDSDVAFSSSCPFSRYLFSFSFFFFQKKEKEETQFLLFFLLLLSRERRRTSFRDANKVLPNTLKLQGESQLLLFNHTCCLLR